MARSCASEPMVLISRLTSCTKNPACAQWALWNRGRAELIQVAAPSRTVSSSGNFLGKNCCFGEDTRLINIAVLQHLMQLVCKPLSVSLGGFRQSCSILETDSSITSSRPEISSRIFSPSFSRMATKLPSASSATRRTSFQITFFVLGGYGH